MGKYQFTTEANTFVPPEWVELYATVQTFEGREVFGEIVLTRIPTELPTPNPCRLAEMPERALVEPSDEDLAVIEAGDDWADEWDRWVAEHRHMYG